ncbi:hypothetical protein TRFO_18585 [Tritrichomonas foetus]|uniref:Ubiquitin-like domain-containing protein n=1 Tax=Tritrichomonas foetus TaxID=1144522 RepID=A0A1J4KPT5_9EUKA|nr:hypothetical protein TRFO_18585 [Tritrichomonas foetus]|eukprot:OHT11804.1 hypothetical protein TRFO_18585 [Tritrichomonas foetus]
MNVNHQSKKISLLVYFPGHCIAKVSVSPRATIGDLRKSTKIQLTSVNFVANGQILNENLTFWYYQIHAGDIIVAAPNTTDKSDISKWLSHTREAESFTDRISSIIDPRTSREAARLRDFQMSRMERKPRCFRKLSTSIKNQNQCVTASPGLNLVIPDRNLEEPSCDPLPVFWANSESCMNTQETRKGDNGLKDSFGTVESINKDSIETVESIKQDSIERINATVRP